MAGVIGSGNGPCRSTHGFGWWRCTDPMVGRSCASLPTGSVGGDAQTGRSRGRARPYPRVRWVGMHRPDGREVVRVPTHGFSGWRCTDPTVERSCASLPTGSVGRAVQGGGKGSAEGGRHVAVVIGVDLGGGLRVHQPAVDGDLEHPASRRYEVDSKFLTELLENLLSHAHGTARIVSRPAELDLNLSHGRAG